jgi:lipoprotein-releasing system permease protein
MLHPLPLFVGLRYVRARSHKFFVSFITWVSLLGVCIGVAALIVILSVMNGLGNELRDRLLSLSSHARVIVAAGHDSSPDWTALQRTLALKGGVAGVAPYAELQALALRTPEMLPVALRGIDPRVEAQVTDAARSITGGRLADLTSGSDRVVVGEIIAQRLGVAIGDAVTLLIPTIAASGAPAPRLREFIVAGVFEAGLPDHDATLIFTHIDDARAVAPGAAGEGLHVRFDDVLAAPELSRELARELPASVEIIDWTKDHANYFRAIRIEKTMMALILLLIVAVAAFNLVAMLVMVVTDKRTDIAILRTQGATPRRIMGVFLTQGLVIGWFGVILGVILGVVLAVNVGGIVPVLERAFGFQVMDADVYYFTQIPSDLRWANVAWIGSAALVLTALATVYPAWRASRVAPAEALRYE